MGFLTKGLLGLTALAAAVVCALLTVKLGTLLPIAAGTGLLLVAVVFARPDCGTFLFIALAYSNAIALIGAALGDAVIIGAAFCGLLAVPIFLHVFVRREPWLFDHFMILMVLFAGSLLLSSIIAKDVDRAVNWILGYVLEGALVYFLLVNAIRSLRTLRTVVWTVAQLTNDDKD